MSISYENDAVKISFNIGAAVSATTNIVLKYKKPIEEGRVEEGEFTVIVTVDDAAGEVYTEVANDVMTPNGRWTFYSVITDIDENIFTGDPFYHLINISGVSITNKHFVKTQLSITDDDDDSYIENQILVCEQVYLDIRNAPWAMVYNETTEELNNIFPIGSNSTIAEMIGYKLDKREKPGGEKYADLTGERFGSYTWSGSSEGKFKKGFPVSIVGAIKSYGLGK